MRLIKLALFAFGLTLMHITHALQSEHLVWEKVPLTIELPLNKERLVQFPQAIKIIDQQLSTSLDILKVKGSLYLKAKESFKESRLIVQLLPEGDVVILNLATLATNESFKQNDEWQTRVEWHQLILFGKLTKVAEYLKKGSQVYLEGKLRSNQWTDNEDMTRQTLSIVVNHIQLLSPPKASDESSNKTAEHHMAQMRDMLQPDSEEIPF